MDAVWDEFSVTMRNRRLCFELRLGITDDGYTGIIHHPGSPVPVVITGNRDTTAIQWFADMLAGIEQTRVSLPSGD
jgi:hypothetical protein